MGCPCASALVLSFFCVITAPVALASVALNSERLAVISIVAVANILIFTRLFGHAEFFLLKQRALGLIFASGHWSGGKESHELEVRLQGSLDWQELWPPLPPGPASSELRTVCLDVNAARYF